MPAKPMITVAPNGARRCQADHAQLPLNSGEIAATAKACFAAGAQQIHLHVRNADGGHSLDAGRYREAIAEIGQQAAGMAIQITTEAAGIYDVAAQYACLRALAPAAASVALREMARDPETAARLYAFAQESGTAVQHILYHPAELALLADWTGQGIVPETMNEVLFVLGSYTPPRLARPHDLPPFLQATGDRRLDWSLCAFGRHELACARAGLQAGGRIRIGFENNIHLPDGRLLRDNAQSIAMARAVMDEIEQRIDA